MCHFAHLGLFVCFVFSFLPCYQIRRNQINVFRLWWSTKTACHTFASKIHHIRTNQCERAHVFFFLYIRNKNTQGLIQNVMDFNVMANRVFFFSFAFVFRYIRVKQAIGNAILKLRIKTCDLFNSFFTSFIYMDRFFDFSIFRRVFCSLDQIRPSFCWCSL